jgi:hypothetical protein
MTIDIGTPPTPAEIAAAVKTLLKAWCPAVLQSRLRLPDDVNDLGEGNDCNCAGEDEDGEELGCNCADSCSCEFCLHDRHDRMRTCMVYPCGKPSRLEVIGWTVGRQIHTAEDSDPAKEDWYVHLGQKPHRTWSKTACGTIHARTLIDADTTWRAESNLAGQEPTRYEVVSYRYPPDTIDLERYFGIEQANLLAMAQGRSSAARWAAADLVLDSYHRVHADGTSPIGQIGASLSWKVLRQAAASLVDAVSRLDVDTLQHGALDGDDR